MQQFLKQVNEIKTFSIDFTPVLSAGETISGANITAVSKVYATGATVSGMVVPGSIGLSGNIISFRVQNGTADEFYKITVSTGATSAANKHEEDIALLVGEDTELLYTVDELKTSLGITNNSSDALLFGIVKGASDYIKNAIGRNLFYKTYAETFYLEEPSTFVLLDEQPLVDILSVVIDGVTLDETDGQHPNWIFNEDGSVKRLDGGTFPCRNIPTVITYNAGYYAIPEDIRNAVKKLCISEYARRSKEGILAETIGNYRIVFNTDSITSDNFVQSIITRYMRRMF